MVRSATGPTARGRMRCHEPNITATAKATGSISAARIAWNCQIDMSSATKGAKLSVSANRPWADTTRKAATAPDPKDSLFSQRLTTYTHKAKRFFSSQPLRAV
jgi:hypothetical protein